MAPGNKDVAVSHNNLATTLSGIAELIQQTKQYDTLVPMYEQGVVVVESSLGAQHPNLALNLQSLASFYVEQDKLDSAVALTERALHIAGSRVTSR